MVRLELTDFKVKENARTMGVSGLIQMLARSRA